MFGMSFIFVIFNDDAEIYWARTRVLERLNFAQKALPQGVTPSLGPDGTGVGHVFWYTLQGDGYDLGELRAVQDWYVKFALQNVEGVSEVASFGGFQKQYQVSINPNKLIYYNISAMDVANALESQQPRCGWQHLRNEPHGLHDTRFGLHQRTLKILRKFRCWFKQIHPCQTERCG
jgi:Cu/Ag efflux pump CusA